MTRLAIFDLDGTLLNTIADLGEACNYALQQHRFPTHKAEDYPRLVGNGVNKLLERALPEGHKDEATILSLREDFIPYYNDHNRVHTHPYEGIPELLQALKAQGCLLAVASNKYQSATETLIRHYFGPDLFDVVLGERTNVPRKPDPQIVFDILQATGCTAEQTLYIGDSDVDMQTATNAELRKVACTWGFCSRDKLLPFNPEYIADQPSQILRYACSPA
ncbi:MAG: HAD family hydrolase [Paludibacteraceae bacterium]|nr:HAD family hydrolase [Paludibacteraceae bacterium]